MKKLKLKKTTLTTIITIIAIVIAYFVMNTLNNSGVLSNVMSGLLVRICVWSISIPITNLNKSLDIISAVICVKSEPVNAPTYINPACPRLSSPE